MIRIDRGPAPAELVARDAANTALNNATFDADESRYLSGELKIDIDPDDYKIEDVKTTLKCRQHNKCCFTETLFVNDFFHVEHFRPKKGVQHEDKTWIWPGYYWLAYSWTNLLLCSQVINTSFKKNYFPLLDENRRNRTHKDTNVEEPVLIDPSTEDPRDHIIFYKDEPKGISQRGRETIRLLGLRHPDLVEDRRRKFVILARAKNTVDIGVANGMSIDHPMLAPLVESLIEAVKPEAEYSSMIIDLLQGWPHLP